MTSTSVELRTDLDHGYAGRRDSGRLTKQLTIQGRELGRRLREAQAAANVDGTVLAAALGVSTPVLSRIMNGLVLPTLAEAAILLALCHVGSAARDRILDLCHPRHDTGILRLTDGAQWDALAFHTSNAIRLTEYQPIMIPWLAQTDDYTAAWLAHAGHEDHLSITGTDRPSSAIRAALSDIHPDAGRCELILHEWALKAPTGGPLVRLMQMQHLLNLAKRAKMSLRVIPARCSLPAAALSGFMILEFRDQPNLLYREDPTGGVFCDEPAQVASHQRLAGQLSHIGLNLQNSRTLIEQIIEEMSSPLAQETVAVEQL
jgi:hypothetical protein